MNADGEFLIARDFSYLSAPAGFHPSLNSTRMVISTLWKRRHSGRGRHDCDEVPFLLFCLSFLFVFFSLVLPHLFFVIITLLSEWDDTTSSNLSVLLASFLLYFFLFPFSIFLSFLYLSSFFPLHQREIFVLFLANFKSRVTSPIFLAGLIWNLDILTWPESVVQASPILYDVSV